MLPMLEVCNRFDVQTRPPGQWGFGGLHPPMKKYCTNLYYRIGIFIFCISTSPHPPHKTIQRTLLLPAAGGQVYCFMQMSGLDLWFPAERRHEGGFTTHIIRLRPCNACITWCINFLSCKHSRADCAANGNRIPTVLRNDDFAFQR